MLPNETPRVLHAGNGTRGPFSLSVSGTPISFAEASHIRVTRFDTDGIGTLQVDGTHYQLSVTSALPDLGDTLRTVPTATLTFKLAQEVLAVGEYVLIERVAPASQDLSLATGGGLSSSSLERTLDAAIRVVQQLQNQMARAAVANPLDANGVLEFPSEADRAGGILAFDDDGDLIARAIGPGIGDLVSDNNLSDLDDAATARTNLGLGSVATLAQSAVFRVANNLSEGVASTMRSNLGLGALAVMNDGDDVDVTATGSAEVKSLADWMAILDAGSGFHIINTSDYANVAELEALIDAYVALSPSVKTFVFGAGTHTLNDTWTIKHDNLKFIGLGPWQTTLLANHTNTGIRIGADDAFCERPFFSGIRYRQVSGTAPFFDYYCGRELHIEHPQGSNVRNFLKVGSTRVAITNVTDNGAGKCRITVGSAQTWQTGMKAFVARVTGTVGSAINEQTPVLTRIDSTTFDTDVNFSGAYTSGGVIAPHVTLLSLKWGGGDYVYISDNYAIDVYGIAGNVRFFDKPIFENLNVSATVPDTDTVGLYVRKNTTAYDALDWVEAAGGVGFRNYHAGLKIDNTRVVSLEIDELHVDGCTYGLDIAYDDGAAETLGGEDWQIKSMRSNLDANIPTNAIRVVATAASIAQLCIPNAALLAKESVISLTGGAAGVGIKRLIIIAPEIEMRPASGTCDAISIAGYVAGQIIGGYAYKHSGAGAARDGIRLAASYEGALEVIGFQTDGMTGYALTADSSIVAGTCEIKAAGLQNVSTAANKLSDSGGLVKTLGAGETDLAVADGGTGASTVQSACANLGIWRVLQQSSVGVSHTGNTTETTLATITIPAGAMGANGRVRIRAVWSGTNSANNKTLRHKFGGTNYFAQNLTTQQGWRHENEIGNRNAANSQVGNQNNVFGSLSAAPLTSAIDTAAAVTVLLTGQLANSGETVTLESYCVEIFSAT